MPDKTETMRSRKRSGIRTLAGGTGLGLVIGCAIGAFCFYRPKAKPSTPKLIPPVEPVRATVDLPEEIRVIADPPDDTEIMPVRKRRGIRWIAGGIGLGLAFGCAIGAFYYHRSRPKPWNLTAIRAVEPRTAAVDLSVGLMPDTIPARTVQNGSASTPDSASIKPTASGKAETNASGSEPSQSAAPRLAGMVMAGLRNNTPEDIALSHTVMVMESEEGTHVLHNSKFALDHDYFIPTGRAVSVTLVADDPCAPENSPEMCVESYFNGVDEIVLFDKSARYEVHIPLKAIRLLRIEPKPQPETHVAVPTSTVVVRQQPKLREESQHRTAGQVAPDPLHPHDE